MASPDDIHALQLFARKLARQAGELIVSMRFPPVTKTSNDASLNINTKSGSSDLVTSADMASQSLIFNAVTQAYPTHRLIGEEDADSHSALDARPTWIVDAIDGTTNFVHGLRDFAVSIAYAIDGKVEVCAVYNPVADEMFSAVRGKGAYLNDKPVHVSSCNTISDSFVLTEWAYVRSQPGVGHMLRSNERLMAAGVRGVRQLGSGTLDMCYVAMGRADAVYCGVIPGGGDGWKIWDYAAASLIAEEAGAVLQTLDGKPFDISGTSMFCSTPLIADDILKIIQQK